jgi:hypothetical protein
VPQRLTAIAGELWPEWSSAVRRLEDGARHSYFRFIRSEDVPLGYHDASISLSPTPRHIIVLRRLLRFQVSGAAVARCRAP